MAKDKKTNKKAEKVEKTAAPEFKYGVSDIAEKLGIKEASVRVQLRNKGIEKAGKSYGWDSKSDLNEVIDQLKTSTAKDDDDKLAKKPKKDKDDKDAKADKSKGKKDKSSKKSKRDEDEDDD